MINQIDPHGPVQQDPSGVPVSTRDKGDGKPFDDFLSGQSPNGKPPLIKDHSPPPTSDPDPGTGPGTSPSESPTLDPIKGMMPRPIRWKETKIAVPKTPPPEVIKPGMALPPQIDPQLVAVSVTLSPTLSPPTPPAPVQDDSTSDAGSTQEATVAQGSTLGATTTPAAPTSNTSPVSTPVVGMIRQMKADPQTVAATAVATKSQENQGSVPVGVRETGSTDRPSAAVAQQFLASAVQPAELETPTSTAADPRVALVDVRQTAAPNDGPIVTSPRLPASSGFLAIDPGLPTETAATPPATSGTTDSSKPKPSNGVLLPTGTESTVMTPTSGTMSPSEPAATPEPNNLNLPRSPLPIHSREADIASTRPLPENRATSNAPAPTDSSVIDPSGPPVLPDGVEIFATTPLLDSRFIKTDQAAPPPTAPEVGVIAPVTDSRVPAPVAPPTSAESTQPSATAAQSTAVTVSTSNAQAELSASPARDRAKIAGSPVPEIKFARRLETVHSQAAVNERIKPGVQSDGTPVAKDEATVNVAMPADEKESDASPLPKRGDAASPGVSGSSRSGNGHQHVGDSLIAAAVSGPTSVSLSANAVASAPTAEPTAARQAVRVETLLQQTLGAGESVRPNGTGQMEMRVRLDGGHEDVTVRMQVVNDRMQVTFQTNSPELRKALEHGWQEFSASASQASTLSMSEPRFEASRFNPNAQMGQSDAQSAAFNQQNSRRQPSDTPSADEFASASPSARGSFTTAQSAASATAGQSGARRWSGWA